MSLDIHIDNEDFQETFQIYRDTRHGRDGWRVLRHVFEGKYEEGQRVYMWDEMYQFYMSLNDAIETIEDRNFAYGRENF